MRTIFLFAFVLLVASCENVEIGNSKDVNPDAVYQSYEFSATEGDSDANLIAQFRFAGENGTTLVLNEPSSFSVDGKMIKVDSTSGLGAFYTTQLPIAKRQIKLAFTDQNKRTFANNVLLRPFALTTTFTEMITSADLDLSFSGLDVIDSLNIQISDTSSLAKFQDVDSVFMVHHNQLAIPANLIARLSPGPLTLYVAKAFSTPLSAVTKEGGVFKYSYQLKPRELTLKK